MFAPLPTPAGLITLRAEQPGDAAFLEALFEQTQALAAQLAHLPAALRTKLLRGQRQAQRQGHAAQHPQAGFFVVQCGAVPVGRLVLAQTPAVLHLVDIALLPQVQGQGVGTVLLHALAALPPPRPLHLSVAADNPGARRLYERTGFVLSRRDAVYLHLTRAAGAVPPGAATQQN